MIDTNETVLRVAQKDRMDQLDARAELRQNCDAYLREPSGEVAEQVVRAMLDYLDGEDKAGL